MAKREWSPFHQQTLVSQSMGALEHCQVTTTLCSQLNFLDKTAWHVVQTSYMKPLFKYHRIHPGLQMRSYPYVLEAAWFTTLID